jgi:membrane protease YdiL (CAAX protease family)
MSTITIILLIAGYSGYFIAVWKNYSNRNHKLYSKAGFCENIKKLNLLHVTGLLFLGLPLVYINKQTAIFINYAPAIDIKKIFVLLGLVVLTAFIGLKTAINVTRKMRVSNNPENEKLLWTYLPIRVPFLFIYEFFFRGVLLAASMYYLNIEAAVLLNVILYTLFHFFSEKEEVFFCPLFGGILCLLTIWFHSVLPALILHSTLSVSHEGYVLKKINGSLKHYQS